MTELFAPPSYFFPEKKPLTFPKETICIKCLSLFSGKNKKNINLLSTKFAQSMVSVKLIYTDRENSYFLGVTPYVCIFKVTANHNSCSLLCHLLVILKVIFANSVDPDQTAPIGVV